MSAAQSSRQTGFSPFEQIALARQIVLDEACALQRVAGKIPSDFTRVVELITGLRGAVVVTGIGKAGWVAQKLSATFASTGTPSHFLHPGEAFHGDLGRVVAGDVVLVLSNSGETEEVTRLLPYFKRQQATIVAMTGKSESTLARAADFVLDYGTIEEACHLKLAPSTSTTVMLGLGDALALVVSRCKGFGALDFAQYHPGGSLGRKLARVEEVMRPLGQCRVAHESKTVRDIYIHAAGPARRAGAILLVNDANQLTGIFTDSDLARLLERQKDSAFDAAISQVMTKSPKTVKRGCSVELAVELMSSKNISELPVINDDGHPIGMIDITDLLQLRPQNGS